LRGKDEKNLREEANFSGEPFWQSPKCSDTEVLEAKPSAAGS